MDEEKEAEQTADDTGTGDKPEKPDKIEQANLAAKRLEEANKKHERLIAEEEELRIKAALSGRSSGGDEEKKEKETEAEYSKRVARGEANPLKDDGFI